MNFAIGGITKEGDHSGDSDNCGPDDPSFKYPTKPIGSFMSEEDALANKKEFGWQVVEDAGRGFRRVVPSPIPREIIELDVIKLLVESGYIVIAAGGGGIPVIRNEQGDLEGVEAVIDKDLWLLSFSQKSWRRYFYYFNDGGCCLFELRKEGSETYQPCHPF